MLTRYNIEKTSLYKVYTRQPSSAELSRPESVKKKNDDLYIFAKFGASDRHILAIDISSSKKQIRFRLSLGIIIFNQPKDNSRIRCTIDIFFKWKFFALSENLPLQQHILVHHVAEGV